MVFTRAAGKKERMWGRLSDELYVFAGFGDIPCPVCCREIFLAL